MADKPPSGCVTFLSLIMAVSIPAGLIQSGGPAAIVGVLMYAVEAALLLSFLAGFGRGITAHLKRRRTVPPAPFAGLTPEQRQRIIRGQSWRKD